MNHSRIKVLIVDDSLIFREVLANGISGDSSIEVVAKAVDPFDARDKILQFRPDVMTCDIEMPKMNGIEFLRRLLPQYPLPVIVVSTVNAAVFDAMNAGAIDFVAKPNVQSSADLQVFIQDLIMKIKIVAGAKVGELKGFSGTVPAKVFPDNNRLVAIGASTGGIEAIASILKALPPSTPGLLVVQHIPPVFSKMLADRLDSSTRLRVKEAQSGDMLEPGKALIAPGDKHMRIRKTGERYKVECNEGEKVNGHCPSVDVLFESVAKEAASQAVGLILTGMGYDGAKGLLAMRRKGARTIGQDEKSSTVYGMPRAAYNIGAVEKQASLEQIPHLLFSFLS